ARREDLDLAERRAEPRRQDAHHLPRLAVEGDVRANEAVAPAEARLPEFVADDAHRRTVGPILVLGEIAAVRGEDAERRKERGADALPIELLRLAVAGQCKVVERRDADRCE